MMRTRVLAGLVAMLLGCGEEESNVDTPAFCRSICSSVEGCVPGGVSPSCAEDCVVEMSPLLPLMADGFSDELETCLAEQCVEVGPAGHCFEELACYDAQEPYVAAFSEALEAYYERCDVGQGASRGGVGGSGGGGGGSGRGARGGGAVTVMPEDNDIFREPYLLECLSAAAKADILACLPALPCDEPSAFPACVPFQSPGSGK